MEFESVTIRRLLKYDMDLADGGGDKNMVAAV